MALGAPWFSRSRPAPPDWNATKQLLRVNLLPVTFGLTGPLTIVERVIQPQPDQRPQVTVTAASPVVEFYGRPTSEIRTAA